MQSKQNHINRMECLHTLFNTHTYTNKDSVIVIVSIFYNFIVLNPCGKGIVRCHSYIATKMFIAWDAKSRWEKDELSSVIKAVSLPPRGYASLAI